MAEFKGKYLSLTTFRKDGTPVATPVWFVAENGTLLVETDADSYKVRRIRRNSRVEIAICTSTGKLLGGPVAAQAELLPDDERPRVERLMARKYRVDRILVLPVYRLVQGLRGKAPRGGGRPVIVSITPN